MKSFSLLVALFGAVVAVGAAGCSSPQSPTVASDSPATSSTPSTAATAAGCAASDVHRVMLDTKAAEEPKLALPTPV